jgi:hypothetical protein
MTLEANSKNIWAISVLFLKKQPKENNDQQGKNSPNLVTLFEITSLSICLINCNRPSATYFSSGGF